MKKVKIKLETIQDIRDFVNIMATQTIDVDLSSGRYVVDAKSIMGIFSLDLLKPIDMIIHSDDCDDLLKAVDKFIVKE
ncbi:MAG TPA: HPr family phosphocarrier protein [Bacillota bacterium]|nr:HPr family phosphocarrier protein [Clostridiales bacterium]HPT85125.1 HPr family phosphocarrier protein [Bacillota bacterium]